LDSSKKERRKLTKMLFTLAKGSILGLNNRIESGRKTNAGLGPEWGGVGYAAERSG